MYVKFESLLAKLESGQAESIDLRQEDTKVILGVLFYSVVKADGRIRPEETQLYYHLLENFLGVSEDERSSFEEAVDARMKSGEDLNSLIELLKDLPDERKHEILKFMQEISISDRELHEVELNLVAKVSRLLGID